MVCDQAVHVRTAIDRRRSSDDFDRLRGLLMRIGRPVSSTSDRITPLSAAGHSWLAEQLTHMPADHTQQIDAAIPALERLLDAAPAAPPQPDSRS